MFKITLIGDAMDGVNIGLVFGGLAVGAVFAYLVQRYRFCLVAGTSNLLLIGDYRQATAFAAALLVAITGTQLLEMLDIVAIVDSSYRDARLDWFGTAVGGTVFGIGATLAGGCAARTLVKTMEGSAHSLIALVSFVTIATIVQFGFLEPLRVSLAQATSIPLKTDAGIASLLPLPPWLVLTVVVAGLVFFIYKGWQRSRDNTMPVVGAVVGMLVVVGWVITRVTIQDEFAPGRPSSITIAGPLTRIGYSAIFGRFPVMSFAVSFIVGTAVVSLLLALVTRQFRITPPGKGMTIMALLGGALMGVGSTMANGCNIGQGLSGVSTLSLESLIAVTGMVAGIGSMTKWMERHAQ